jgi:hypothetical protein
MAVFAKIVFRIRIKWLKTIQAAPSTRDDLPNVKDGAGELLLVGEGELDG